MTSPQAALRYSVTAGETLELDRHGDYSLTAVAGEDMAAGTFVRADVEDGRMVLRRWTPDEEAP